MPRVTCIIMRSLELPSGLSEWLSLPSCSTAGAWPGLYPSGQEFRDSYGHSLTKLFAKIEEIRDRYTAKLRWKLPDRTIAMTALQILSEFAEKTRCYNLNILVGSKKAASRRDPIDAWYSEVGEWIISTKYTSVQRKKDYEFAGFADILLGEASSVAHIAEDGKPISSIHDAALRSRRMELIQRESTFLCARIARHISELITELVYACRRVAASEVPDLFEFFAMLYNEDKFLQSKKVFYIHSIGDWRTVLYRCMTTVRRSSQSDRNPILAHKDR